MSHHFQAETLLYLKYILTIISGLKLMLYKYVNRTKQIYLRLLKLKYLIVITIF